MCSNKVESQKSIYFNSNLAFLEIGSATVYDMRADSRVLRCVCHIRTAICAQYVLVI